MRRGPAGGDQDPLPPALSRSPGRATIQDVAREAGVSPSAVSKVLREAYGVSPAMRERVNAAIDRLGYRPRAGARAMRGSSYTVGVMLIVLSSPFQLEIVEGISDELLATPYQEVLVVSGPSPEGQRRSIEALVDRQVDGLVLIAPGVPTEWLEELAAGIPTVVVARHGRSVHFDSVNDDDAKGARLMVDHLVDLGHRRITHIAHPTAGLRRPSVLSHTVRADGYRAAMRRRGLDPDVIVSRYTEEGGYAGTLQALDRATPPTAVFAGADIAALGALRAAEERGWRVPEDLTVTGYDNTFLSSIGRIDLTTVDQSGRLTGATSARLLLERLGGRSRAVSHVIDCTLVPRGTSAAPRKKTIRRR
jgi:LacI family transcriptional regulator